MKVRLTSKGERVTALFADLATETDRLTDGYAEVELDHVVAFLKAASESLIDQTRRIAGRWRFTTRRTGGAN